MNGFMNKLRKFLYLKQSQLARVEGHSIKEIERTKQLQAIEMQIEYEKRRALTEVRLCLN